MFRPSIPNLVYQYCVYVSYGIAKDSILNEPNTEIGDDKLWEKDALKDEREAGARAKVQAAAKGGASPPIKARGNAWTLPPGEGA